MRWSSVVLAAAALCVLAGCDQRIAEGRADGAAIFAETCARCHGPGGVPDAAMAARLGVKDLTDPALHARLTDAEIRRQILKGSDNQQMPAFEGALTEEQVAAITRHVRSLKAPH